MLRWIPPALAVAAVVLLLRRGYSFAVSRGWLYGPGQAPKGGNTVGGLGFEQVFQPSVDHVIEEQQRLQIEADHQVPSEGRGTEYGVRDTPPSDSEATE